MATWRIDLAYDGSEFSGWARQPGRRTVQEEVEAALGTLLPEPVSLTVAGRTDAGVHARRQVASFQLPEAGDAVLDPQRLTSGLNALTPRDIAILSLDRAPGKFDARRDALSRTYTYRIEAGSPPSPFELSRAWWWPYGLDSDVLHRCAALLPGLHDFTAFTPSKTKHVRFERNILAAGWREEAEAVAGLPTILVFTIEADAFMRSMVRILVGTMVEFAAEARDIDDFRRLLEGAPRAAAGRTAPAHGLYLDAVRYRDAEPGTVD